MINGKRGDLRFEISDWDLGFGIWGNEDLEKSFNHNGSAADMDELIAF